VHSQINDEWLRLILAHQQQQQQQQQQEEAADVS
jgi:hypothetical protein